MDTPGQDLSGAALSNKLYSSNPYRKRGSGVSAGTEQAKLLNEIPPAPVPQPEVLPPHLVAVLAEAIEKTGRSQQEYLLCRLNEWLPQLPFMLTPVLEQHLEKLVPKVIRVDQPGPALLKLVRYLTGGMIVLCLMVGGLLFAWLQTRQEREMYAAGYWQHRYVSAQTAVARSAPLQRLLSQADSLCQSPAFMAELQRLESILDTRRQQYQLRLREQELTRSKR